MDVVNTLCELRAMSSAWGWYYARDGFYPSLRITCGIALVRGWHRAAATTFRRGGYLEPAYGCSVTHVRCSLQLVGIRFNVETGSIAA